MAQASKESLGLSPTQTERDRVAQRVKVKIELTDAEKKLFDFLLDTLKVQVGGGKTVLRCAGGWVRDKLLGLDSDDIDIAINDMTGEQFGAHVQDHMKHTGMPVKKVKIFLKIIVVGPPNPSTSSH